MNLQGHLSLEQSDVDKGHPSSERNGVNKGAHKSRHTFLNIHPLSDHPQGSSYNNWKVPKEVISSFFYEPFRTTIKILWLFDSPTYVPTLQNITKGDYTLRVLNLVLLLPIKNFSCWSRLFSKSAPK